MKLLTSIAGKSCCSSNQVDHVQDLVRKSAMSLKLPAANSRQARASPQPRGPSATERRGHPPACPHRAKQRGAIARRSSRVDVVVHVL
eukprot:5888172-Heterocapsa_arctica.AAC.1